MPDPSPADTRDLLATGDALVPYGFFMGRTEVTWGQVKPWHAHVKEPLPREDEVAGGKVDRPEHDPFPANVETWANARAFGRALGAQLPREREWVRAARGEATAPFPWGDLGAAENARRFSGHDASCPLGPAGRDPRGAHDDGFPFTAPAGSFPEDRSAFGCLDVVGNVSEWCADAGPAGRWIRGGNWHSGPTGAALTHRGDVSLPSSEHVGFRVAVVPGDPAPP